MNDELPYDQIVSKSHTKLVPNKKGQAIYRASGGLPIKRVNLRCRGVFNMGKDVPYKEKSNVLKIYQIFHDNESFRRCFDSQYITPFSVVPDFKSEKRHFEQLGDIPYPTNQISESRAILHAIQYKSNHQYLGFTTHKHDLKFYRMDRSVPLANINEDLVHECLSNDKVKFICFRIHPAFDFIKKVLIRGKRGAEAIIAEFLNDCYRIDCEAFQNLKEAMDGKLFPYCNCYIAKEREIQGYGKFLLDFLNWAENRYGLDRVTVRVERARRSYSSARGWGYICEQLPWYYLAFRYGKDFLLAFIGENGEISYHDRIGYGLIG